MTEYVLGPDEDHQTVARRLLDAAKDPASVMWSPRPNTHPHGGVYVLADEEAEAIIEAVRKQREAETARIEAALSAAEERDSRADETGLTPEQLGFPGASGSDPGAPGTASGEAQAGGVVSEETVPPSDDPQDAADEAVVDDPSTPQDEHAEAENRVARRRAARKADASADEQKSE